MRYDRLVLKWKLLKHGDSFKINTPFIWWDLKWKLKTKLTNDSKVISTAVLLSVRVVTVSSKRRYNRKCKSATYHCAENLLWHPTPFCQLWTYKGNANTRSNRLRFLSPWWRLVLSIKNTGQNWNIPNKFSCWSALHFKVILDKVAHW